MKLQKTFRLKILVAVSVLLGACGQGFRAPVVDQTRMGQIQLHAKRFDTLFKGAQRKADHELMAQTIVGFTAERQSSPTADGQFAMAVLENNCQDRASLVLPYSAKDLADTAKLGGSYLNSKDAEYGFNVVCVPQLVDGKRVCNQYIVAVSKAFAENRVGTALILMEEVMDPDNVGQLKLVSKNLPGLPAEFVSPAPVEQALTQSCEVDDGFPAIPSINNPTNPQSEEAVPQEDDPDFSWITDLFDSGDPETDEPLNPFVIFGDDVEEVVDNLDDWFFN